MPSRLWYWATAAIALAGAAGAVLFLLPRLAALQEGLVRVVVPGTGEMRLARPGAYTIFHEARSAVEGTLYHAEDISGLAVALRSVAGNRGVPLAHPGATTSYTLGGRAGTSVFTFEIDQPGVYRLSAAYAEGRNGPRTVLAVGQGIVGGLFGAILGTIGIAVAAFGAAVVIASVVFLRRRQRLRTMQPANAAP